MLPYKASIDEIYRYYDTCATGLSDDKVTERLKKYGQNKLTEKKKVSAFVMFLMQFKDFMIIILMIAAVVSGIMGDITDTMIIFIIIILNAVIGFVQEFRAEKSMEALKKMATSYAQVIRNNELRVVETTYIVPGDIVMLEAGLVVPADMRLTEVSYLLVDEASLTGESVPVEKSTEALNAENISPGDQKNMCFKGTMVTHGRGKGVVVATGMNTELGKIALLLQEKEAMSPLQIRMAGFGRKLSYIVLGICVLLFITGIIRGENPYDILLLSVSLAVAAIPEALPALITIALSNGAVRLARQNALVRKLPAVETLGSVTFICSDKTGTLTQNKMQVTHEDCVENNIHAEPGLSFLSLAIALNHDVKLNSDHQFIGEPTEIALVRKITETFGTDKCSHIQNQYPRITELPFDSDRKCMTTVHRYQNRYLILTKGASEAIAEKLNSEQQKKYLLTTSENWAAEGIRVLAYAYKFVEALPEPFTYDTAEKGLYLIGIIGLMDPPRPEVKNAIDECKTAGIVPVMITGDHPATARAIASQIGILTDKSLNVTGKEFAQLSEEKFHEQVENTHVYARVSPDQKLRIVKALQAKGHFVAMTGDGVNDAPSLKAANIGIAMGINGTDVSKEAAHLILLDDNFATIVKAVKEGRRIFENIRKFVKYIMTCNAAEIWTIFLAPFLGLPMPLLPIHILWINLVTDGLPGLALGKEKAEDDIMKRPPRKPSESLFADGTGYHIVWVSLLMSGITLGIQTWALRNNVEHWQTMVFCVLAFSQLGHALAIRGERTFIFQQGLFSNPLLWVALLLTMVLQVGIVYIPFCNTIFKTQPLSLYELIVCFGASLLIFHAVEAEKWIKRMKFIFK